MKKRLIAGGLALGSLLLLQFHRGIRKKEAA